MQIRRINQRQRRWTTPVVAAVASVSVVAAAAFGGNTILKTQEVGSGPIEASVQQASFADGSTTVVDDAAIASQGGEPGPKAVKEFHRDQQFSQFALTWTGDRDIPAFVRAKQADGTWSEWYETDSLGTANSSSNGKTGTELIFVGPTNDIQVSVGNVDLAGGADSTLPATANGDTPIAQQAANAINPILGDTPTAGAAEALTDGIGQAEQTVDGVANIVGGAADTLATNVGDIAPMAETVDTSVNLPSDLDVVFIDGNAQDGIAPVAESYATGAPDVVSRSGWGANEGIRCQGPDYDDGVKALVLHHTAGSNNYTQSQAAAQVRGIYQYHAQTLGWCDIGYNVLVDKFGTIYEGRYGGLDKAVQGAHVGGFNSNTWGISMMGNYSTAQPTSALIDSVAKIAGWKAAVSGFAPDDTVSLTSGGFKGSRYPAGSAYTGPAFLSHRDLHFTECPGNNTDVDAIREDAQAAYEYYKGSSGSLNIPSFDEDDATTGNTSSDHSSTTGSTRGSTSTGTTSNKSTPSNATSSVGNTQIPVSTIQAVVGIAASIAGIALAANQANGGAGMDLKDQTVGGISAEEIPGIVSKVVAISGDEGLSESWTSVLNAFGPLLGLAVGGPDLKDVDSQLVYQLFTNGAVLSSKDTGTHALVGEVAKKWAQNPQQLGLPTSDEYTIGGSTVRVDFQGGYITYDPTTQKVDLFTN